MARPCEGGALTKLGGYRFRYSSRKPVTAPFWPPAEAADLPDGPLNGVQILDLSRILAGPFATMVLGDLGADVIKVERPGAGDDTRGWGPPFHPGPDGDAAYFLSVNRHRRSLTLDLRDPLGAVVAARLAGAADIVLENFLPRHAEDLGIERLKESTPGVVWVSIRGAAGDGPAGSLPGYDVMAQARGGLMGITGHPETGPVKVGVAIADVVAGLYAAVSALAGLAARDSAESGSRPKKAPRIEVGLLEAAVSALVNQAGNYLIGGTVPAPLGNDHPNIAPYGPVRCADRPLVVGAGNDRQFASLCTTIGVPELAEEPRFATNAQRIAHRAELGEALTEVFQRRSADDWQAALESAGVPCAPVNGMREVFADPHVTAIGLVGEVQRGPDTIPQVRSPLRVDGRRPALRRGPPQLGEDTDPILRAMGYDESTIAELRSRKAI